MSSSRLKGRSIWSIIASAHRAHFIDMQYSLNVIHTNILRARRRPWRFYSTHATRSNKGVRSDQPRWMPDGARNVRLALEICWCEGKTMRKYEEQKTTQYMENKTTVPQRRRSVQFGSSMLRWIIKNSKPMKNSYFVPVPRIRIGGF